MARKANPNETPVWAFRRKSDESRYALWDSLADLNCDSLDDTAIQFCMREIASLIDAQSAFWAGTVRVGCDQSMSQDPYKGWRLGSWVAMDTSQMESPEWMHTASRIFNKSGPGALGENVRKVLAQAGEFRVFALSKGMVDFEAFQQSEYYDYYYRQQGIVDRIWVMSPVNENSESVFCFDRMESGGRMFDNREVMTAAETLRGIKWFHRQVMLARGLGVAQEALTPSECAIVRELLTGAPEKEIARRMSLTPATAHQYVVRVYRKYGVHARPEFMSLWLNKNS